MFTMSFKEASISGSACKKCPTTTQQEHFTITLTDTGSLQKQLIFIITEVRYEAN